MGTSSQEASLQPLLLPPFFNRVNSFLGATVFHLRREPFLEGFGCSGKKNRSHLSCSPLWKWWKTRRFVNSSNARNYSLKILNVFSLLPLLLAISSIFWRTTGRLSIGFYKEWVENPKKLTQLSPGSHPRHLVGNRTAQKDAIKDITSDRHVKSYFP